MSRVPVLSLYTGAGGLDLGFVMAGYQPIYANDVDHRAADSYDAVVMAAMRRLGRDDASHSYVVGDLSSAYGSMPRNEDAVVIGGPPCQGFSRAGKMDPHDPRSRHVRHFVEAVNAVKPRAFVMENVRALAESQRWVDVRDSVLRDAEAAGYDTELLVLNALNYGVPQSRERMFLIGVRRGEGSVDNAREGRHHKRLTVRDALHELHHPIEPIWQKCRAQIVPAKRPVLRTSPFAGMMFNGQGRPLDLEDVAPTISASLGGNHTPIIDQAWLDNESEAGGSIRQYHSALSAGGRPPVPSSWRRLSLREAARLQSFPANVAWKGPLSSRFRHVGNAVPPLLAFEVARRVAAALDVEVQPSEESILGYKASPSSDALIADNPAA